VRALAGGLINSGSLYAVTTSAPRGSLVISANNISNLAGGLISTVIPTGGLLGLNLSQGVSLSLVASHDIFNAGTISSAGSLNLVAGHAVINQSASNGAQAVISAINNVNIATPYLLNSGLIQATTGNIAVVDQVLNNVQLNALSSVLSNA